MGGRKSTPMRYVFLHSFVAVRCYHTFGAFMYRIADVKRIREASAPRCRHAHAACIASLFICSPHATRAQLYALTAYLQQSLDGEMALKTAQQHSPKALLARREVLGLLVLAEGDLGSLGPCVNSASVDIVNGDAKLAGKHEEHGGADANANT